jgi:pimeloyl-ACP methyl ester carboxylesterase
MGGFIALKLATMHPERLLSVAPCGAGWTARPDDDFKFIRDVADALDAGQGFTLLIQRLQPAGKPPNLLQGYLVNALMLATNDVKAVAAALRGMEQLQVTESELRNNRAPALAIIGENDPLKVVADQMAAVMANLAYAVIPNSDHVSTLTQLKTIETFQEFLAQDTPNTAPSAHACRTLN